MRVLIAFLALSFILGGRAARSGRADRVLWVLGTCLVVAILLSSHKFS